MSRASLCVTKNRVQKGSGGKKNIISKSSATPAILVGIMRGWYEVRVDDYSGGKIV